jgi:hypothetical protein
MSWICVVGINVVVDAEKKYGELVDVCIPRPRSTSRDSSIGDVSALIHVFCRAWGPHLCIGASC